MPVIGITFTHKVTQIFLVIILSLICGIIVAHFHEYSLLNLIPMVLMPLTVGIACNRGVINRLAMSFCLVTVAVVTLSCFSEYMALF